MYTLPLQSQHILPRLTIATSPRRLIPRFETRTTGGSPCLRFHTLELPNPQQGLNPLTRFHPSLLNVLLRR